MTDATETMIDRIRPFTGVWDATVQHWMQPGADPMQSTGTMTNEWVLGDKYLRQQYVADMPPPGFEGTGYWGYNRVSERWEGFWIDSMSYGMTHDLGDVDASGTVWTMAGEVDHPTIPGKVVKRSVITLVDDDHHNIETFMTLPDGTEFKVMRIDYVRKA